MRLEKIFTFSDMNKKVDMHKMPDTMMFSFYLMAEEKVKTMTAEDYAAGTWKPAASFIGEVYVPVK